MDIRQVSKEMLAIADMIVEMKKRGFKEQYPVAYEFADKSLEERIKKLEEMIKEIRGDENED
ncbi:hypothetical protein I6E17_02090 [Fusobacterium perfoetens]|uniref:hypothetical protein n=1 Tax=Fusobacterium perfoetens TaxID=852 RepID=UPI001F3CD12A|nr:hypothetical protein [Fusobacterium perfoetens]MCF2624966.1 hypothetical protein [Fusobacterium perfoetens]